MLSLPSTFRIYLCPQPADMRRAFDGLAAMTQQVIGQNPLSGHLKDAGLPPRLSPHSFRVTAITDLLSQGVPLEEVPHLAGHADPRTTRLYDRRQRKVTQNVVERISV